jgi:SAM-dependent methyltransferase
MISPLPHREKKASAVPAFIRILQRHLSALGLNPGLFIKNLPGLIWYTRDYRKYLSLRRIDDLPMGWPYPVLHERRDEAGRASGHYFHQDLWAARLIREANPTRHVDIGSRIDGFVAHLLTFREVEVVDIRPLASRVAGLKFIQADATTLSGFPDRSLLSVSSLHAAEHFGLGRYGDRIDPDGHLKFMSTLERVLAPGGRLYFSVPCGRERVEFNAYRVLAPETVIAAFGGLRMTGFAAVMDDGELHEGISPDQVSLQDFACGLFVFEKPQ